VEKYAGTYCIAFFGAQSGVRTTLSMQISRTGCILATNDPKATADAVDR